MPTDTALSSKRLHTLLTRILPGLAHLLDYDRSWLRGDLMAGVSIAAVALPVGIAYAEITGVPAEIGIYSALFPLLAYALFGSSRQLIVGPDAATCLLVAVGLAPLAGGDPQRYLALMVVLTLLTGVFLLVGGLLQLGFLANFLSRPILGGFLNGTALVIIAGQLKTLFGYPGEAKAFFPRLIEFAQHVGQAHLPTMLLGLSLLMGLLLIRHFAPRLPSALLATVLGIALVTSLDLDRDGVQVLGSVPAGLPSLNLVLPTFLEFRALLSDAAAIALLSFISGILTVKSFAYRSRQTVDANQELISFGACNIVAGLTQGFPVTGASSRTAVNVASGGKSQLAGIVAAGAMLLVLFYVTEPLGYVPKTALAAVIIVSSISLFDYPGLRELYATSRLELGVSLTAMTGVLLLGVLPGVALAVGLSLAWVVYASSRPPEAVLGRVPGMKGFHSIKEFPEAVTVPGLLIYQFSSNIVFYNAEHFKQRVRSVIAGSDHPVEWVVLDFSAVSHTDVTGIQHIDELAEELAARNIRLVLANYKRHATRFFEPGWVRQRDELGAGDLYPTIRSAVSAFQKAKRKAR